MNEHILLNKTILVAEDNSVNQIIVKHTLAKLGCTIDVASNGLEAIEMLKEKKYDLVLMDIQMPYMDGYDSIKFIRNQLKSNIPVIAMTAFALHGEEEKCYQSGMNGYVSKPFNLDSLSLAIEKALSYKAAKNSPYIYSTPDIAVDVSVLYDISANDENYIQVMVQTFVENMVGTLKRLEEALNAEDWEGVYKAAHYAKSALSIIKVHEMFEPVLMVENRAKKRTNLHTLPSLAEKINEKFTHARQVLAQKFNLEVLQY